MSAVQRINDGRKLSEEVVQDRGLPRVVALSVSEWQFVLEALDGDHPFDSTYKRELFQKIQAAAAVTRPSR